ncbi:hypothetical protein JTB14_004897 [Gonioctena quinquepunctata]|nr:hypothetical protein JTB14_004897 [Gonioctena quinquepunctata]
MFKEKRDVDEDFSDFSGESNDAENTQGDENNRIEVSQRQSYHEQESPSNKRTYSQIVQRKIDSRTGYDKQAHNELLLSPNGQILQAYNGVVLDRQKTNNTEGGIGRYQI